jgi:MYXO-CTERM domain-containing protein
VSPPRTGTKRMTAAAENDVPTAGADRAVVDEGAAVTIDLAANDADPEHALDLASITVLTAPTVGAVVAHDDGTVTYTHDGSDTTSDSFTYTIRDAGGAVSNVATVTITVNPVLDDRDADGVPDTIDNCPDARNAGQEDGDENGLGDACDPSGERTGCGCQSGGDGSLTGAGLMMLVGLVVRRRSRIRVSRS